MGAISGTEVQTCWYSPRDGSARAIGRLANRGEHEFTPSGTAGDGNDWVLVLDDASKRFPPPGD